MLISCAQTQPLHRSLDANLKQIEQWAARSQAEILVFPELATTGYFFRTVSEVATLAFALDSEAMRRLQYAAKANNRALITGFLEEANGRYFNSSVAIDCHGHLVGHYRKIHLFYMENQVFQRGNLGLPVFELETRTGSVQTGMMICYDWRFPETARTLGLKGGSLIAVPSNIVTTTGMLHTTLQTRAFENKVVLAFADRVGNETSQNETLTFRGESCILDFNGEILTKASLDAQEEITANVDFAATQKKSINVFNDIFRDRRPEQYR